MFFLAFVAAWSGSAGWVVVWAVLGLIFSQRSGWQSVALMALIGFWLYF